MKNIKENLQLRQTSKFNAPVLAVFALVMASFGGYFLFRSNAAPNPPTIYLQPVTQSVSPNSTFTVQVRENSGSTTVNGTSVRLSYPTNLLSVSAADIASSASFATVANTTAGSGSIVIDRAVPICDANGNPANGSPSGCTPNQPANATGDQLVATITFHTLATTGSANVAFTSGTVLVSSSSNQDILGSLSATAGGTYSVVNPSMYLQPATQTVATNTTFTVQVRENSGSTPVNGTSVHLSYPTNLLSVSAADIANSPDFATSASTTAGSGSIVIDRAVPICDANGNPANGDPSGACTPNAPANAYGDRLIATITFHTLANAGAANVAFTSGTVLVSANNSQDILGGLSATTGGTYTINIPADSTPPTVSVTAPTAGTIVSGNNVTVSANAADNVGVVGVQFKLDGTNLGTEDTTSPYSTIWNTTTATSGTHTLTAVARDAAGNSTTSTSVSVTVDNSAPTVSVTAPANGATVNGSSVAVNATAGDNVGVVGVQFKLDGANLSTEDTTSPYGITWNSTTATNGSHTITAVARDAAGNTTTSTSITVTVDNSAPTVLVTAPVSGATVAGANVSVSANASDNVGVVGVQFKLDGVNLSTEDTSNPYGVTWNSTTATNGSHTITAVARDAAGNTTTSSSVTVTVDNSAPTVSVTAPANGATVNGSSVAVNATAGDNVGVVGVQFKLDGANLSTEDTTSPYGITWNSTTATNGSHTITAVARDAAGNTTTSTSITVTVDNSAPTVSISSPANNSSVRASITVSANATDNVGVVGVQFKLDGANLGAEDATSPYSVAWDTTTATGGAHTLTAVARDAAGNTTTTSSVTVTVDNTAPTVSVSSPANGATVSGSAVTISASASDNVGIAGVQFKMDGNNQGAEDTTSPYSTVWDTTTLADGTHTLTAVARDAAGNITTSTTITVTVNNVVVPNPDTTAPTVPSGLTSPSKTITSITLNWNASTDPTISGATTSGLAGYRVYRSTTGVNGTYTLLTSTPQLSYTDNGLSANTSYSYKVAAYDNAGNESAQTTGLSVTTNANPPTVTISANPTSVASGGSSTLTWSSTNATTCSASGGWTGTKGTSGTQSITNITVSSSYTLTCTGTGGSANNSATVTVIGAPTVSLAANPTSIVSGTSSTLTWTTTGATTCSASGGWTGTKGTSGTQSVSPTATTTYTITCTGAGGSANTSTTVTVTPAPKRCDLNGDNRVDLTDLSIFLTRYNTTNAAADFDHSGFVDIYDLSILLTNYEG